MSVQRQPHVFHLFLSCHRPLGTGQGIVFGEFGKHILKTGHDTIAILQDPDELLYQWGRVGLRNWGCGISCNHLENRIERLKLMGDGIGLVARAANIVYKRC